MRTRSTPWVTTPWNLSCWGKESGDKSTNRTESNRPCCLKPVILSPAFGRRISRDASYFLAASGLFGRGFLVKSRDRAIKSDTFREILRPKDGHRMTGFGDLKGAGRPS